MSPSKIDCKGVNYCRERAKPPSAFDKRSFRTISIGQRGKKLVVACPVGHWHPRRRGKSKCDVGMQRQTTLHPIASSVCKTACRVPRRARRRTR